MITRGRTLHRHHVSNKEGRPCCLDCGKSLTWEESPKPWRGRRRRSLKEAKQARRRFYAAQRKLAIRCLDCLRVFCQPCARRHFVPMHRTYRAVDEALAKVAVQAISKIKLRCS
jgi:hypothetical protein